MLLDETANPLATDAERARADSLALWQNLIVLPDMLNLGAAPSHIPYAAKRCGLDLAGRYRIDDGNEIAGEFLD